MRIALVALGLTGCLRTTSFHCATDGDCRLAGAQGMQVCLSGLEPGDDRVGVAQEQVPCLGQRDRARAARALDELLADDPLERRDLLADRRLGVAQGVRGPAERRLAPDRGQRDQITQLQPGPAIPHGMSIRNADGIYQ